MIANKNAFIELFSLELLREKVQNILENSGNLVSHKCDHPAILCLVYLESAGTAFEIFSIIILIALMCARILLSPDNFKMGIK